MSRTLLLTVVGTLAGCTSFDDTLYSYAEPVPEYFRTDSPIDGNLFLGLQAAASTNNAPPDNRVTDEGAALGRLLFYDVNLSQNGTIACASCHKAEFGFSDDRVLSIGFDGGETGRHSMRLANARYYENGRFFWDQRAETLEDQVLMPCAASLHSVGRTTIVRWSPSRESDHRVKARPSRIHVTVRWERRSSGVTGIPSRFR